MNGTLSIGQLLLSALVGAMAGAGFMGLVLCWSFSSVLMFPPTVLFVTPIAVPSALVIGVPTYLLSRRLHAPVWLAALVAGALSGCIGSMASQGFGLMDPAIVHGRYAAAFLTLVSGSKLPTLAGIVGGVASAAVLYTAGVEGRHR